MTVTEENVTGRRVRALFFAIFLFFILAYLFIFVLTTELYPTNYKMAVKIFFRQWFYPFCFNSLVTVFYCSITTVLYNLYPHDRYPLISIAINRAFLSIIITTFTINASKTLIKPVCHRGHNLLKTHQHVTGGCSWSRDDKPVVSRHGGEGRCKEMGGEGEGEV